MTVYAPEDVMATALGQNPPGHPLLAERSDGHVSRANLAWWRREPGVEAPADVAALSLVPDGPVLDIGCATGRHVELLRASGFEATGIDRCETAVNLARSAGQPCQVGDAWADPAGAVGGAGAVVALGGNLGIAGTAADVPRFLQHLCRWLGPGGVLIVGSIDWRVSEQQHRGFLASQRRSRTYPGDVRLRLRCGPAVSSYFPWVWVDRDSLAEFGAEVGLRIDASLTWGPHYAARLVREAS